MCYSIVGDYMNKTILLILDGFGLRNEEKGNAVKLAHTPYIDKYMAQYPNTTLEASGEAVGLPKGEMGNSKVGHLTLGAGRKINQPLSIINESIDKKEFYENKEIISVLEHVNKYDSALHIMGLLSDGGIHSSIKHFYSTLALAKLYEVKKVYFHFFMDGRDTYPMDGVHFIEDFQRKIEKANIGTIGTLCGRYYAMDRDNKWDRIQKAYDMMVNGKGLHFSDPIACMNKHYENKVTDEFINPSIIDNKAVIKDNDGIFFVNYRPDRMKQLLDTFKAKDFKEFEVKKFENLKIVTMFNVYKGIPYAYDMPEIKNTFSEYINGLEFKQARIAETEKFAHVTYFFDGGATLKYKLCDKFLINSPLVPTYDMKPVMSVAEVTETALKAIDNDYDFILVNFANPDMVGHTGNLKATIDALEVMDFCVGKIHDKAKEQFYELIITADHGNAEYMIDADGNPCTTHSTNKVPFILCNENYKLRNGGTIADVIPTIIDLYEIKKPEEMTGESLIIKEESLG